eukprot:TRINITY_DN27662_c0_g1_i1.p1 TRINITY_DN27662_c0_g1~~TRINITY_DN27662_c0_g1_i1.p1  ORF type:complete len:174 (+),score=58.24 TRINITY_DN27662_c0_g1_i1:55-576(+)
MQHTVAFICLAASAAADVTFSRTFSQLLSGTSGTVDLAPAGTCSGSDDFGANDCTLKWGTNYTVNYDATLPKAIDEGFKVNVDATIDSLLPLKFSCAACGADCTFTVPVVGKQVTIPAVACPLVPAGETKGSKVVPLPAKSPLPVGASMKGSVTLVDGTGAVMGVVTIDAKIA